MSPLEKFPDPRNRMLLDFLRKNSRPKITANVHDLDEFDLRAHPDLCGRLYALNPHCKAAAYGYPLLVSGKGVIFALGMSTAFLAFRLPEAKRREAIAAGGRAAAELGEGWVSAQLWGAREEVLGDWCREAHAAAEE